MKNNTFAFKILNVCTVAFLHCYSYNAIYTERTQAVKDLIKRSIGNDYSKLFAITINVDLEANSFVLNKSNNEIQVIASDAVAAAFAFNHYLKYYCKCHISWDGDQISLPENFPDVRNVRGRAYDRYRYYQNVCAYSYSYVWWDWKRWEREIDWMALNGFNMGLAFVGQEGIWRKIYKSFNLTESEIEEHFAGPSFMAWSRMGNIRRWGGPLDQYWHERAFLLQHKILHRMRTLGIIPVLPCFAGHVPTAFARMFPLSRMDKLAPWSRFPKKYCCPFMLHPTDPLFQIVGSAYMKILTEEFGVGNDAFFGCDPFNENKPPSSDDTYLKAVSGAIFKAIREAHPHGSWLVQGWAFGYDQEFWTRDRVQAFLSGVPNEGVLLLDLISETLPQYERLNFYFGKSFLWCMLHNFGGTLGMHGSLSVVNQVPLDVRGMNGTTMVGFGIVPEGINQNYIVYDFAAETPWRNAPVNMKSWIMGYSERRYGKNEEIAASSWHLLVKSLYNYRGHIPLHGRYTICSKPSLNFSPPALWYDFKDALTAWDGLIAAGNILQNNHLYDHDIIDLTRQMLQTLFDFAYLQLIASYRALDIDKFHVWRVHLLEILTDMERILSTNEKFMLGPWLEEAKEAAGGNVSREEQYRRNFKTQITIWGPREEILDYASKQWSGVVDDYYRPRWELFLADVSDALTCNVTFNQKKFEQKCFRLARSFISSKKNYPLMTSAIASHQPSFLVTKLRAKWNDLFVIMAGGDGVQTTDPSDKSN